MNYLPQHMFCLLLLFISNMFAANAQTFNLGGKVCDAVSKECLPNAVVRILPGDVLTHTDKHGKFNIKIPHAKAYNISIEYIGYEKYVDTITINTNTNSEYVHYHLTPSTISLNEMVITANSMHTIDVSPISVKSLNKNFFLKNNAATLAQTLSKIPGVASMDIGAGMSKPVIRGMGFNRIAVVDKGIVMQNQQWGADHGLSIDQFDVDNLLIHKGPMSLFFGSDAMGGVIEVLPPTLPKVNQTWGDVTLLSKWNNALVGGSVVMNKKQGKWFVKGRFTALVYGDYRIPTDTIEYLTWKMPVSKGKMKNTAGREFNGSIMAAYISQNIRTTLFVSDNFVKNGFFPGSHGVPDLKRLADDGNRYNIDFPYTSVNHFKLSNSTEWHLAHWKIHSDIGYQRNNRQELAAFHTHYSNQLPPQKNPNTELKFVLNTYTANIRATSSTNEMWYKTIGIATEYQNNNIAGYTYLLPAFRRIAVGVYAASSIQIDEYWKVMGGVRYDFGRQKIAPYFDPILFRFLKLTGHADATANEYAQRTKPMDKTFGSFSGSVGFLFEPSEQHLLKGNIGRSFRFPTPNELASNGVHHGAFRHELGESSLEPEVGLQLDIEYELKLSKWRLLLNPFAGYFSNYIYLNPMGEWSVLPHAGQLYRYQQARIASGGSEVEIHYRIAEWLQLATNAEYLYSINLDTGYPLPFSPPVTWTSNAVVSNHAGEVLTHYSINLEVQKVFEQNRISINEESTTGTTLLNMMASFNWKVGNYHFSNELQIYNIFNTPYLNHISFYRKLNAPEPGRNIQLILKIPF